MILRIPMWRSILQHMINPTFVRFHHKVEHTISTGLVSIRLLAQIYKQPAHNLMFHLFIKWLLRCRVIKHFISSQSLWKDFGCVSADAKAIDGGGSNVPHVTYIMDSFLMLIVAKDLQHSGKGPWEWELSMELIAATGSQYTGQGPGSSFTLSRFWGKSKTSGATVCPGAIISLRIHNE